MKQLYSRYFPTPSYLAMNSCALDISDQSIKYGELHPTSGGLRLGRFGQEKIAPGVIVSGKIEKEEELIKIIQSFAERENLHFVRVSLPEEQMYLFTLSVPKTAIEDIRDSILLQIEEHIPLSAVDTIFDYHIIREQPDSFFVEVTAVSQATIESYLSLFEQAGVTPVSFELEAQAIARAVIPKGDESPVMIVDFGEARTGVSISHNGRVFFTTTLDIGGETLTNILAKNFNISYEKAEEMKRAYGIDGNENIDDIFPVILNGLSVLRDELNKHYVYWQTHDEEGMPHEKIDRIILCGGDANLTGLADYLQASLKIKVEHANVWTNITTMSVSVPDMSFQDSLGYATVLGLALGDYVGEAKSLINVLPLEQKHSLKKEYWMRLSVVTTSLLSLMCIIATVLLLPPYFFSSTKSTLAEARLEAFNSANTETETQNLDTSIVDINKKLVLLTRTPQTHTSETVIGGLLEDRVQGITYSQILYSENAEDSKVIELHGESTDRNSLYAFKSKLSTNTAFTNIKLPISNFIEPKDINFTISIDVK